MPEPPVPPLVAKTTYHHYFVEFGCWLVIVEAQNAEGQRFIMTAQIKKDKKRV